MALTKVPSSMLVLPLDTGEGTAVASSATTNLDTATGNFVHITGTTTITAITLAQGASRWVVFDGILTLTHSASLILPGAANIVTAAGDVACFIGEGSSVTRCVYYSRFAVPPNAVSAFTNALVHVREEQTSGTDGGTFTLGARRIRVLNTVKTNEISGVALSSDTLTGVPAGTYHCEFACPAYFCREHKAFLYNVTGAADLIVGTSEYAATGSGGAGISHSIGRGRFTLAATSTLRLEHQCTDTVPTTGFGNAGGFGTEVWSELLLWKLT